MKRKLKVVSFFAAIIVTTAFSLGTALAASSVPPSWSFPTIYQGHTTTTALTKTLQAVIACYNSTTYNDIQSSGGPDGVFGTGTTNAVKAFQTAKGLTADGKVGPSTWAALRSFVDTSAGWEGAVDDGGLITGINGQGIDLDGYFPSDHYEQGFCYGCTDHHWYFQCTTLGWTRIR